MALRIQRHLDQLPAELLRDICDVLDFESLKSVSSVNRSFRNASIPRLYERLSVPATASGLDLLKNLVASRLAVYVKVVALKTYPRLEDVCSMRKDSLSVFGKTVHMCTFYKDQTGLLENMDTLITTLQQLPALEGLALRWSSYDDERFSRFFVDRTNCDECFRKFLFAISTVILLRATQTNPITSLKLFASRMEFQSKISDHILKGAFVTIRELVISGQDEFLEFLIDDAIELPSLERLDLIQMVSIPLDHLRRIFNKTRQTLSAVRVECSYLWDINFDIGTYIWHIQKPDREALDYLHTLGQLVSLKEVSLRLRDYPTVYTDFFALLLLKRATPSDFESFIEDGIPMQNARSDWPMDLMNLTNINA